MDTGDVLRTDRASRQPGSGPTVAVGYGTTEGHAARIAGLVGEVVAAHGYRVRPVDLRDAGAACSSPTWPETTTTPTPTPS